MADIALFPRNQIVGVFKGFTEGGLEFHAELVLPYQNEFQSLPMHGQFLLIQLETQDEAVLGRITSLASTGKLSFGSGEEFNIRAVQEGRAIPEDLREQYLRYKINIRVLGVLRNHPKNGLNFVPSHRRLPHVGSPVAFPSDDVLKWLAGHEEAGAPVGHFALGEYIYSAGAKFSTVEPWMQVKHPEMLVHFPVQNLVSRRSFVFARAGFGKSNLTKLLFSKLYETTPTVAKRGGRQAPVGTIIFDPDGEYFWPDDKGRPGLCDVPALKDQLVVFTPRNAPSEFYRSFVVEGIRLDIRTLKAADVISLSLPDEKQGQQNVIKLKGLNSSQWRELVDLIDRDGNQADIRAISEIMHLDPNQEVEALAARSNMTAIVRSLHDRRSRLIDALLQALADGKLCVVDVSQMQGSQAFKLTSIILKTIFDHNQDEFTEAFPKTIPTIAVIEEAQSVLNERDPAAEPIIAWVKEGRKYDLGALLITQQPGSISTEILSQGDNWFIFHLLSSTDLVNVKRANAHFSDDLLSVLLNEPIPGQGVFWSSVSGKPYPVSMRVLSFEQMYAALDPEYSKARQSTYAEELRKKLTKDYKEATDGAEGSVEAVEYAAIEALRSDTKLMHDLQSDAGAAWGAIKAFLLDHYPQDWPARDDMAYRLVRDALNRIFGPQSSAWETYKHPDRNTTYVRVLMSEEQHEQA